MGFEDLTPEQMERARACKTPEEMFDLAKDLNVELTKEQLDAISGGDDWDCVIHGGSCINKDCELEICGSYWCFTYWCGAVRCNGLDCGHYTCDNPC